MGSTTPEREDYEAMLERARGESAAAKDTALRQLEHLRREIDYGYGPARIRTARRIASRAVTSHILGMEAEAGAARALNRRFPADREAGT